MKKIIHAVGVSVCHFKFWQSSDKRCVSTRYGIDDKEKKVMAVRLMLPFAQQVNEWSFIDIMKRDFDFLTLPKHSAIASSNIAVKACRGPLPKSYDMIRVCIKSGSKPFFVHDIPHSEFRSLFSPAEMPKGAVQPYIQLFSTNVRAGNVQHAAETRESTYLNQIGKETLLESHVRATAPALKKRERLNAWGIFPGLTR
jgi:hypothetical protein